MDQVQHALAFAGIDWGGLEHQLCVVDGAGHKKLELRVAHDVAGLDELLRELAKHGDCLPVAIERAEGLLVEHLQANGHPVFPLSPRIAARARERYRVAPVKDDRFDAFVLADTLRHEYLHWRALSVPSPLLAELRALTRDRDRLLETQQATEAQLRAILESYHPAPARLFSSMDRQIALAFVADYPTPQIASRVRTTRMTGFLRRNGYTGRVPAQVLAERMRANLSADRSGRSELHRGHRGHRAAGPARAHPGHRPAVQPEPGPRASGRGRRAAPGAARGGRPGLVGVPARADPNHLAGAARGGGPPAAVAG